MKATEVAFKFFEEWTSGIVSTAASYKMPSGEWHQAFWCRYWAIITDDMIRQRVPGFRSTEKWQLAAVKEDGTVLAIFPGCQVKCLVVCDKLPTDQSTYRFQ